MIIENHNYQGEVWKMNKLFNKLIICFVTVMLIFGCSAIFNNSADAAGKKKAKGGLSQEQLDTINKDLNTLTKKIYAHSLFSPKDNETMINIKLDLDDAMLKTVTPEYAPLYYLEANLLKNRNYKTEAIECYQTIMENFAETAFAPKAKQELLKMGVKIETNFDKEESEDEE